MRGGRYEELKGSVLSTAPWYGAVVPMTSFDQRLAMNLAPRSCSRSHDSLTAR